MKFEGKYAARRQQVFDELVGSYEERHQHDPVFIQQLIVYATVIEQVERLTRFVDENGMTYSKFDTTGNETQHLCPQVTQLACLQKQIISMAANLKRYAQKENDDEETDDGLIR
jgi:hypothetical protein